MLQRSGNLELCGQMDGETAALSQDAADFEVPSVGLDQPAGNGQSQAAAAGVAGPGRVGAVEPVEQPGQIFGGDSGASILHCHRDAIALSASRYSNAATLGVWVIAFSSRLPIT